jgi:spore germination cell wall hydrolase CwlJ-like protein
MKNSPRFLRRLKKLTLVHLGITLYLIFSLGFITYELFIFEENIPVKMKSEQQNSSLTNALGSVVALNSNLVKNPIFEEINKPLIKEDDSTSTTVEQETSTIVEDSTEQKEEETTTTETITQKEETTTESSTEVKEEQTTVVESTTQNKEETVKLKFTNFDYSKPQINNDLSLEQYIYSLIEEYSSYETRVALTYKNVYLLARLSIAESEDQCFKGNIAVCEVAVNRSVNRGQTLEQVIFAKNPTTGVAQFSCTVGKKPRINLTPRKIDALAAVRAILGDMPTDGSNYFVDPVLAPNSWAERNRKKSIKIEDHQFFY